MSKHTEQPLSDDTLLNPNSNPKPILADENISNNSSAYGDYVTFNLDGCTATQRKELKDRLTSELEQVRSLQQRIEEEDLKNRCVENAVVRMKKACREMLRKLMEHEFSNETFGNPVDAVALGLYDYHTIISRPMDLGTVKSNLENGFYSLPIDFANDVRLTFTNAMTYNPKDHYVYHLAEKLLRQFDVWFKPALTTFQDQLKLFGSSDQRVWNQNQWTKQIPIVTEMGSAEKKERKGEDAEEEEEEDVDIGVETPIGAYPPVEIEKDDPSGEANSSGSSSSNGSSSSSDSKSGSSSGSDSEAPSDKNGG